MTKKLSEENPGWGGERELGKKHRRIDDKNGKDTLNKTKREIIPCRYRVAIEG